MTTTLCDTCAYDCKQDKTDCDKYDRDCSECIFANDILYYCDDCEFEPEEEDE